MQASRHLGWLGGGNGFMVSCCGAAAGLRWVCVGAALGCCGAAARLLRGCGEAAAGLLWCCVGAAVGLRRCCGGADAGLRRECCLAAPRLRLCNVLSSTNLRYYMNHKLPQNFWRKEHLIEENWIWATQSGRLIRNSGGPRNEHFGKKEKASTSETRHLCQQGRTSELAKNHTTFYRLLMC